MVIERDRKAEWPEIFCYSPAADETGKGFRLGYMSCEMAELLRRFGAKGICVDATHNTTRYKLKLVTVLVLDDRQTGRPVACFFCNERVHDRTACFFRRRERKVAFSIPVCSKRSALLLSRSQNRHTEHGTCKPCIAAHSF